MDITVVGRHAQEVAPERATLYLEVGFDSGDKQDALTRTTALAQRVSAHIQALEGAGVSPLTSYAVHPVTTSAFRPHADSGAVLPPRHLASAELEVTFRDFQALAEFAAQVGGLAGVMMRRVEWTLTGVTRDQMRERVLTGAVADAHARALVIARAAGASGVTPVEIADPGLLTRVAGGLGGGEPGVRFAVAEASYGGVGAADALRLVPEELRVEASVHARFTTT